MKEADKVLMGNWRITAMDMWDADYVDMEVPAHITIHKDLTGEFQFGLVQGQLDGRAESNGDRTCFEFSWSGFDENDPISDRGWLKVIGDQAEGRIFIHFGDECGLKAERM